MRRRTKGPRRAPESAVHEPAGGPHRAENPVGGKWLSRGTDGRLAAFALAPGVLLRWTEARPGGPDWDGPESFPVPPGLSHLSISQGANGYLHFLAHRTRQNAEGRTTTDLMYSMQYQSGRPLNEWRAIGNPYKAEDERHARLGRPTGAVDGAGTLHVFVRNAGRGLHVRHEDKDGKWRPWQDLRGSALHEGVTVGVTSKGRIGVLGPSEKPLHHWQQAVQGGAFERLEDKHVTMVPGTGVALETAEDQLTFYVADAYSPNLLAIRPNGSIVPIGGAPGGGALCALRTVIDGQDCTVLVHRGVGGTPVFGAFVTNAEEWGVQWADVGRPCLGDPATVLDAHGRIVVAMLGTDGIPRVTRQSSESGLTLGQWRGI
ncbi:hypothetical protein [Streptomyces sp. DH24]|uniref:hypothetical protein n=1 Tax=Streptomyces sp. DH24 TaxID=3040123 RepID=UPI0024426A17|nr:hypothetical protein [Streptomyces sp. DH24]MDG9717897.1 hypothetical protein [Streptomyces sp. DH24]